jgi:ElaB/YqjD/DUF883 family membrane-anchored ribosome-binding protein
MSQATEQLINDLKILAADAEELVRVTAAQTGDRIVDARSKFQQSIAGLKPRLTQAQSVLAENAKAADAAVRDQPWAAVGIAAGVGLLLGLLIGRS